MTWHLRPEFWVHRIDTPTRSIRRLVPVAKTPSPARPTTVRTARLTVRTRQENPHVA